MVKYGEYENGCDDFQRLRGYLDKIYFFGCFSRKMMADLEGFSMSHGDHARDLLDNVLPIKENIENDKKGEKSFSIKRSYETSGQLPLQDVYTLTPFFNDDVLEAYFTILSKISQKPDGCRFYQEEFNIDKRTVKEKLNELSAYGYIEKQGDKYRASYYDLFEDLSLEEFQSLYDLVQFSSLIAYPRVAGGFLLRTIEREANRRGYELNTKSPYIMRHTPARNILDEVLVYQLLSAIKNKKWVCVDIKINNQSDFEKNAILPMELRVDGRLGRWYCVFACVDDYSGEKELCVKTLNLSRIKNVTQLTDKQAQTNWCDLWDLVDYSGDNQIIWKKVKEKITKKMEHNLFSTYMKTPSEIKATFDFEDYEEKNRFLNELSRYNPLIEREEGKTVEINVTTGDNSELVPLFRAYSPYLVKISGDYGFVHKLKEKLSDILDKIENPIECTLVKNQANYEKNTNKGKKRDYGNILFNLFQNREFQLLLNIFSQLNEDFDKETIKTLYSKDKLKLFPEGDQEAVIDEFYEIVKVFDKKFDLSQIILPVSAYERDFLRFILSNIPESYLFEIKTDAKSHSNRKKSIKEKLGEEYEIVDLGSEYIKRFDRFDEARYHKLYSNYKVIHQAIKERKLISLNGGEPVFPWKLEYRGYDHHWWLIYCNNSGNPTTTRIALDYVKEVEESKAEVNKDLDEIAIIKKLNYGYTYKENVVIHIVNKNNAVDRCLSTFENYDAIVRFLGNDSENNQVYEISFPLYTFFKNELVRILMNLGSMARYVSGPCDVTDLLKQKCKTAIENIKNNESSQLVNI